MDIKLPIVLNREVKCECNKFEKGFGNNCRIVMRIRSIITSVEDYKDGFVVDCSGQSVILTRETLLSLSSSKYL